ncbi:MAG: twin-arginine translocation signal domain-containing protein [Burkholderiaceae bacterium]
MIDRRHFLRTVAATGVAGMGIPTVLRAQSGWDGIVARGKTQGEVSFYSSGVARMEEPRMAAFTKSTGVRVDYARPGGAKS